MSRCLEDSAFSVVKYPFLIKSAQDDTNAEGTEEMITIRQATFVRQASEWEIKSFQGSFPRIKYLFMYEQKGEKYPATFYSYAVQFNIKDG